jgi:alpha-mannosidase
MTMDRGGFLGWLAAVAAPARRARAATPAPPVTIAAQPTALYQQPDGRTNLLRITVTGLDAPAARARVTDRRGVLVGTAGLLPGAPPASGAPTTLAGEVWVPLSQPSEFEIELEVGKRRVARRRVRLVPPRRWTLYWLSSSHTDVGYSDLQERCLEIHRANLDAALARLAAHPGYRWTAECALQVLSYVENRPAAAGAELAQAIREGKVGFTALFASLLTGILDHETLARAVWPAGLFARERGLGYLTAQIADVPGQVATLPLVLAASGVRYLVSGVTPERAVPLLSPADGARTRLAGDWTAYPQLYWWEGPDGSRVLHWRSYGFADGPRFAFDAGAGDMARRLSDWLLGHPVFLSPDYPYDVALLHGATEANGLVDERLVANLEDFNRRYAFPRIVPGRAEDFFREVEQRWGARLPVRRGDTGVYREDGAASTAADLARYRAVQLAARAAELLALWDEKTEPGNGAAERIAGRAAERRQLWRDVLLFGEHTWGSAASVSDPDGAATVAEAQYKRRLLERAAVAADAHVAGALLRIGLSTGARTGRVVCNASTWARTDIVRVPDGAGRRLTFQGHAWPAVDLPDGSALVVARDVPAHGYVALAESARARVPPQDDGTALEAQAGGAGGFHVVLDPATGAIRSLTTGDGRERVRQGGDWSGLNQLIYVAGGRYSALWTDWSRDYLATAPELAVGQAELMAARRERLPGIGVRLLARRRLAGTSAVTSVVTLYDELPWVDIENRITKPATREKEALYVAFPFALTKPVVEVEVPLGRLTVERDQQPGSCRDWYCHAHWVWLHDAAGGMLWSGPDTPLVTLNDLFRGQWRRTIEPDGTLFAYALHNYWHTNFAAAQGGDFTFRFRVSPLAPGADPAEPVRRGWAACDPLYVSGRYAAAGAGPLPERDSALFIADRGVLVLGAKPADDGEGAIVKLLDVSGVARAVGVWPAGYGFRAARRANLVEMNDATVPVAADARATLELPAWGVGALRLFTPRERDD